MKYDIFISYSREDIEEVTNFVNMMHERIPALTYWFDITGIESGDEFEEKIISAINDSAYVLFALSGNSIKSKWTKDEVTYAKNTGKKVIPLLLDEASLEGWFLFKFGHIDCIDSTSMPQVNKLINDIAKWTGKRIVGQELCEREYIDAQLCCKQKRSAPPKSDTKGLFGRLKDIFSRSDKKPKDSPVRKAVDFVAKNQSADDDQDNIQTSVFAPAEVRRKSHFLVQVYLHLSKDTQMIEALASQSDRKAERRDYTPLRLKLKYGDKVDIDFSIYGSDRLMNGRKSMAWQGVFDKCSFDYFVPADLDVDQLCCEVILSVGGIPVGEMRFLTDVVDYTPRKLHPEIISNTFKKIFISYAHEDSKQVCGFALAYKAQGVDYFFDRDKLEPGDIYEEKIFQYIDDADLFILCWSANAAKSEYVAKERGRALSRAYPQRSLTEATLKIFPISIEPRTELPADMKPIYNFIEL